jgi:hypothetical protein
MNDLPKPRRKSAKHRALSAERKMAEAEGRLPEWYAQRAEEPVAREASRAPPPPPPPAVPPSAPLDFSIRTLDGASWSENSRYMRWTLPTNTGSNRPTPPRNF